NTFHRKRAVWEIPKPPVIILCDLSDLAFSLIIPAQRGIARKHRKLIAQIVVAARADLPFRLTAGLVPELFMQRFYFAQLAAQQKRARCILLAFFYRLQAFPGQKRNFFCRKSGARKRKRKRVIRLLISPRY